MDLKFNDLFTNEEKVETHYFHLSKADLVELEVSRKGGLQEHIKNIITSEDGRAIIEEFKDLILRAYGVRSEDGKRFIKNEEVRQEFYNSEAYSTLFLQLCTDADAAAAFINGIVPGDLLQNTDQLKLVEQEQAEKEAGEHYVKDLETPGRNVFEGASTPTPAGARLLSRAEMLEMDGEELRSGLAEGRYILS